MTLDKFNVPEMNWYLPFSWSPDGMKIPITGSPLAEDESHAHLYLVDASECRTSICLKKISAKSPQLPVIGKKF